MTQKRRKQRKPGVKVLSADEFLNLVRERALALGREVMSKHGEALEKALAKKKKIDSPLFVDRTSPNLKKIIKIPGAFCNSSRRPIPIGS